MTPHDALTTSVDDAGPRPEDPTLRDAGVVRASRFDAAVARLAVAPGSTPPGWHVDPLDDGVLRYWDGQDWTPVTQPAHVPPPPPGWSRLVDATWWQQPANATPDHTAAWHLLAQHAREQAASRR